MKKLIYLLVIATLLISACGGKEATNTPPPQPTQTPPPTEPPPTEAPPPTEPPAVAQPTEAPEPTEAPPEPTEAPIVEGPSCDEPVKIGFITDQSGILAAYGTMTERGFMLGMEYATGAPGENNVFQYGGCEIEVLVRDDQSSPDTTATLARELIEVDDVDILVGTVSSGATATLQELALENDIVLIVAPAASNDITGAGFNDHTFRTSRENYQDFINLCQYITTQYDTFVQIAPDYSFGYGGAFSARDACTFFGGEFVADDIFAPLDTTEFTPYMEQILESGADAWIVTWAGTAGFIAMYQTAADLGVFDEVALASSFADNAAVAATGSDVIGAVGGILYHYTAPDNPINDWLVEQVKERFDTVPDLFDADGMNAAIFALEAITATDGDTSAAALIPAMEGMEFEGPKGTMYIRPEDHVAIQDMYVVQLLNVDDPEFRLFELVDTTRPEPPCLLPEGMQDRCGDLPIGSLAEVEVVEAPEGCTEDLTGETFTFYSQAGLTGALSTILGTSFVNALNDSIADLNAAGGICGAMVELDLVDTQYEAEQEIAAYQVNREKDPKPLAIATYGSAASIALKDMVIEDQIVNFAAGLNAQAFYVPRNGYTVGVAPIYSDQFAGFAQFLSENWDDIKPEGAGDEIVIGVIGWEGPFGAGATTPEALAYAESLGITVLDLETYAISAEADVVTPLQSLAVQGANVIYVQSLGFGAAQVIGTLRALEMWDSVVVGGNVWSINQDVLTVLGDSAPAMIGFYGMFPWRWWNDTDVPGVQQVLEAFERGGYPEADKGVSYISSYAGTFAWAEIIKHAINRVGYENLDGETFFEAFQDLGTVSALGIFEYDVRGENRSPRKSQVRQVQLVDGEIQFVVVQDFFELPDTRPPAE